jgi:N-acetylglucosaminyl-diphospho-decaprenol L-rhamnosyltransferase
MASLGQAADTQTCDVSVLIVGYRSRATIGRCLDALAAQTCRPAQVLLLENGSPEGERIDPADLPAWVEFVSSDENLGFAGGNNRLAALASGAWLALLNPDAFAEPDWLEALMDASRRYSGDAIFGSTQLAADQGDVLDGVGDVYHASGFAYRAGYGRPLSTRPAEGEVFGACAAAMLVRRDLFEKLGGFDEDFFCYNEDVDFAFRARLAGFRAIQLRTATVAHLGYASSGRRSEFATYYGARNRLWVFIKNMPALLFWPLLLPHIAVTMILWLRFALIGQGAVFGRALGDAVTGSGRVWRKRGVIQAQRTASLGQIARALSWDPRLLLTRAPDVRPAEPD